MIWLNVLSEDVTGANDQVAAMKRLILAMLLVGVVSPAWAGSKEINDCERLTKSKLKFPGSYKREAVISDSIAYSIDEFVGNKPLTSSNMWHVTIEFTARVEDNSVHRRLVYCDLVYKKGGLISSRKLDWFKSTVPIKYD